MVLSHRNTVLFRKIAKHIGLSCKIHRIPGGRFKVESRLSEEWNQAIYTALTNASEIKMSVSSDNYKSRYLPVDDVSLCFITMIMLNHLKQN